MKLILWVKAIMFGRYMYVRHSILSYSNTCEHLRLFITYKFVHVSLFCDMNLLVLFWGQHTHHYIYIYIFNFVLAMCALPCVFKNHEMKYEPKYKYIVYIVEEIHEPPPSKTSTSWAYILFFASWFTTLKHQKSTIIDRHMFFATLYTIKLCVAQFVPSNNELLMQA